MRNEVKLKNMGLEMKVRFYHQRISNGGAITVCLILTLAGARGVAFCSPKDQFVKKTGHNIALGRAMMALKKKQSGDPISKTTPAYILTELCGWTHLSACRQGAQCTGRRRKAGNYC